MRERLDRDVIAGIHLELGLEQLAEIAPVHRLCSGRGDDDSGRPVRRLLLHVVVAAGESSCLWPVAVAVWSCCRRRGGHGGRAGRLADGGRRRRRLRHCLRPPLAGSAEEAPDPRLALSAVADDGWRRALMSDVVVAG